MEKCVKGRLLVVGAGAMGEAILSGILAAEILDPSQIIVVEPNHDKEILLRDRYGIEVISKLDYRSYGSNDICLFAVKPQIAHAVLAELAPRLNRTLFVSIAIGITIADYYQVLNESIPVVRVMPNMPIAVGEGVSLISYSENVSESQKTAVTQLFESAGRCEHIPEEWQSAGATISGSGPAYFSYVIDALITAGVGAGLPADLSKRLAAQTAVGVSKMILETGRSPREIMQATASPGGITEAALKTLDSEGVNQAIVAAFLASVDRAAELEDSFGEDQSESPLK
ncbi:MAG: pyrroline-5-carboxylate reductase [Coriobacteriia bacterium]|nr:pyrroline-5-carboxylate reductase [Coriobacteriia bacterium]MCL2870941.1 pyrroline-5-carboxylate reductase [Coriobacteriia bacterium]